MRRSVAALLTLSLLGLPAVAHAAPTDCPLAVQEVEGTNAPPAQVSAVLNAAATTYDVPREVLRAIAYVESRWKQFDAGGGTLVAAGDGCAVGVLGVSVEGYSEADQVRLAEDYAFNVREGARLLREQWDVSQETMPPAGGTADDDRIVENWFHAVCGYGGCGTDVTYPMLVAGVVSDPFRYAPNFSSLRPFGFTTPFDADPSYVFPGAFQARQGEFVFYDGTTGTVAKTVAATTHTGSGESVYPPYGYVTGRPTYGPDGQNTTCTACDAWHLVPGKGIVDRAHWATTVTGPSTATVTVDPVLTGTGAYRIRVFVPAADAGVLGTATYLVGGKAVTVDQDAHRGGWKDLGTHTMNVLDTIVLGNSSTVAGRKIVADAVMVTAAPRLNLAPALTTWIGYGEAPMMGAYLSHANTHFGGTGWKAILDKRPAGKTAWTTVGTVALEPGDPFTVRPSVTSDYRVRWLSTESYYESATSTVTRFNVAARVAATIDSEVVGRGESTTVRVAVAPNHAGRRVYLQRLVDGLWQNAVYATLSSTSRATFRVAKQPGVYYYRAFLPGHTDHVAGASGPLRFEVLL